MSFPLTLCTGLLRSGSTWSFNVCRLMTRIAADRRGEQMGATFLSEPRSEEFFRNEVNRLQGHTVLKIHVLGPRGLQLLHSGRARAVCTYRDPRDCVASMMTFASQTFEQSIESISTALHLLDRYSRCGNTQFVRYEEMMKNPRSQIQRIADYLGIALSAQQVEAIDRACGIEQSKRVCEDVAKRPLEEVQRSMDHLVDPVTWLHNNHIQSGKEGRWREELNEEQTRVLQQTYAPWLARLGYGNSRSDA